MIGAWVSIYHSAAALICAMYTFIYSLNTHLRMHGCQLSQQLVPNKQASKKDSAVRKNLVTFLKDVVCLFKYVYDNRKVSFFSWSLVIMIASPCLFLAPKFLKNLVIMARAMLALRYTLM